jgi:hypothetical protein
MNGGESMGTDKITIIGIGEVPTVNNPGRTQRDIIYDTCMEMGGK